MRPNATRFGAAALTAALAALLPACSMSPTTVTPIHVADPLPLAIAKLDHAAFDALNACADDEALDLYSHYLAKDVEVFHGAEGLTAGRKAVLEHAERELCGKRIRVLVDSSIKVHPLEGYGAVETGRERWCTPDGKACELANEFTIVWQDDGGRWRMKRVLRYGQAPKG